MKATYDDDTEKVTLPSGKSFTANFGVIGISPDGYVREGWDGAPYDQDKWSPEDRRALADLMIERWRKFGEQATKRLLDTSP